MGKHLKDISFFCFYFVFIAHGPCKNFNPHTGCLYFTIFLRLKMDDKIYRIPVKRLGGARETFSFKGIIDFIN